MNTSHLGSGVRRLVAAVLATSLAALLLAACGNDEEPLAEVSDVKGVSTAVALDKGFVDALTKLKVKPGPVGKAKIKGGSAIFPITGGEVKYYDPKGETRPYVQGELVHEGSGLSLTAGKTKVELTDFVIDPGESTLKGKVTANGEEAASDALLFNLDGSTLKPLKMKGKNAILEGTTVNLSKDAAELLNKTFKIKDLKEGLKIGISTITIKTG